MYSSCEKIDDALEMVYGIKNNNWYSEKWINWYKLKMKYVYNVHIYVLYTIFK
jgi:hypothetical protein